MSWPARTFCSAPIMKTSLPRIQGIEGIEDMHMCIIMTYHIDLDTHAEGVSGTASSLGSPRIALVCSAQNIQNDGAPALAAQCLDAAHIHV
jgi:hypothetical protein